MGSAVVTDRCPGVLRLHQAADGWLARVRVPGGRIPSTGLEAIASLAQSGRGVIELTSRASIQIRGLSADDGDRTASLLGAAGLLPSATHERVRNIVASPVAGRHPHSVAEIDGLVADLDRALCADPALSGLSGRFMFAVHDGSPTLDAGRADLALTPIASGTRFELIVAGISSGESAPRADAVALILAAAHQALGQGGAPAPAARLAPAPSALSPGILRQRDGRCAVTATVPLARLDPDTARSVGALARCHGTDVRIAPDRSLTLVDLAAGAAAGVAADLDAMRLIPRPSGWQGLTACAGLGACGNALVDVRARAVARAGRRGPDDSAEHWSACPRECGRPTGRALVATAHGPADVRISP